MRVLIVGGGRIGAHLAEALIADGHKVTVVEKSPEQCERLRGETRATVVCGDGNDPAVLREAGAHNVDVLAAVTGEDEDNLVAGLLGKFEFGVPRTIGRIRNPLNEWLYTKQMGIDIAVNPVEVIAKLVEEEMTVGDIATLLKLRGGDVALVEARLEEDSPATNRRVGELSLPPDAVLVAILRDHHVLVASPDLVLLPGDEVLAITTSASEPGLAKALTEPGM